MARVSTYYARTRAEVAKQIAEALRDLQKGISPIRDERLTVSRYLADWLDHIRPTVRPNTFLYDEQMIRLYIVPNLGRNSLSKLTPAQVQRCLTDLLNTELSPTTVRHVYGVLHKALDDALRLGHVQRNVTDGVTPPRRADQEMQVLISDQAQLLLRIAESHRLYALLVVALSTGMRLGELLALRWRDVDLNGKTLQVRATLNMRTLGNVGQGGTTSYGSAGRSAREVGSRQSTEENTLFAPPKTKRSRRQIQLSTFAVEALHTHHVQQVTERAAAGDSWLDLDLVFPNQVGHPLDPANLRHRVLQPLLARAGLPRIRFHDLRHTAATLLLEQGVNPKIVSDMLGHAGISITIDVYSHALPDIQQWAAAAMDTVFGRDKTTTKQSN